MRYSALRVVVALLAIASCVQAQTPGPAAFDGARAHEHVKALVAMGPRVAGTPGAEKTRDYIVSQLKTLGLTAEEQAFDAATPVGAVRTVNLRVMIPGGGAGA